MRQLRRQPAFTLTATHHARARHRGEHRDLRLRRRGAAQAAAVSRALAAGRRIRALAAVRNVRTSRTSITWTGSGSTRCSRALPRIRAAGSRSRPPRASSAPPAARVSDDFFRTLGVTPALGRDFRSGEDLRGRPQGRDARATESGASRYGAVRMARARRSRSNGAPYEIVGVLPAAFHFAPVGSADFWMPLQRSSRCDQRRSCHNLYGVARLHDGCLAGQRGGEHGVDRAALEQQYPDSNRDQGAAVVDLADVVVGNVRPILWLLLGGAALLMVIASLNVAGLLVVRSESRRRELAVRSALGASSAGSSAQFVTESVVLVAGVGRRALALAYWAVEWLSRLIPAGRRWRGMPFLQEHRARRPRRWCSAWHRGAGRGALRGDAAAARDVGRLSRGRCAQRARLGRARRGGGSARGSSCWSSRSPSCCWSAPGCSAGACTACSPRISACSRIVSRPCASWRRRATPATSSWSRLQRRLLDRVAALPGVTSVGLSSTPPLARRQHDVDPGDGPAVQRRAQRSALSRGQPRLLHRARAPACCAAAFIDERDDASHPPVAVVNQALVRKYFPGQDAARPAAPVRADVHAAADGDRRHRRRHQGERAGRRDAADDVRGVRAGSDQRLRARRADVAGGGSAAADSGRRGPRRSIRR